MKKNTRWSRGEVWSRPSFCVELKLHISQGSARMHGVSSFCSALLFLPPPPCECLSCCVFSHTMDSFECTRHRNMSTEEEVWRGRKKKKEKDRCLLTTGQVWFFKKNWSLMKMSVQRRGFLSQHTGLSGPVPFPGFYFDLLQRAAVSDGSIDSVVSN